MKAKIRDKWIDALTSGKYHQATGQLGKYGNDGEPDRFCCLGVLCDILLDDDLAPVELDVRRELDDDITFDGGKCDILPRAAADYVGICSTNPSYEFFVDSDVSRSYVYLRLTDMNDQGLTFSQIADIIRWAEPAE